MLKILLLLAGYPGTGKTYLCNQILRWRADFTVLSPDEIKERNWDQFGFDHLEEKEKVIEKSWHDYYEGIDTLFPLPSLLRHPHFDSSLFYLSTYVCSPSRSLEFFEYYAWGAFFTRF